MSSVTANVTFGLPANKTADSSFFLSKQDPGVLFLAVLAFLKFLLDNVSIVSVSIFRFQFGKTQKFADLRLVFHLFYIVCDVK